MFRLAVRTNTCRAAYKLSRAGTRGFADAVGPAEPGQSISQAPNRKQPWAPSQMPKSDAQVGPRFLQHDLSEQPNPLAAIELIAKEPIRFLEGSSAVCDGEKGSLQGHPRIFINIEAPGAHDCLYCGLRYANEKYRKDLE